MMKILVTHAVNEEFVPLEIDGCEIRYICTGIGKTKSTLKLTKAICDGQPDVVLNIGTAGTLSHKVGDIFVCRCFIDRDFQIANLPGVEYEIDFSSKNVPDRISEKWMHDSQFPGTCNTGDSFVTEAESIKGDVVDMEAFSQAVVCREFDIPFVAVKYVTDVIGQNSVGHWQDKLADARAGLRAWFDENTL